MLLPWMMYQIFFDPPGDRLLKWHFAGQIPVTDSGFIDAVSAAYASRGIEGWLAVWSDNINAIFKGATRFPLEVASLFSNLGSGSARNSVIVNSFFSMFYSMWMFSPIIVVAIIFTSRLFNRRALHAVSNSKILLLLFVSLLSLILWILLMFIPGSTVIHQGSLFVWVGFMACAMAALFIVSRIVFVFFSFLQIIISVYLYFLDIFIASADFLYLCGLVVFLLGSFVSFYVFAGHISESANHEIGR
jgi:hypothetical protein